MNEAIMNGRCACPEPTVLRGLLEDTLPALDLEQVTQHVGECPACQHKLEQLAAADPLALQKCVCAAVHAVPGPDSALWPALRNLEHMAKTPSVVNSTPLPDPRATAFLDPPDEPGQLGRLGHFRILRVLARGGMGLVLHAFDPHLQRDVAIKVLDPQLATDDTARQRFCREARAAAGVSDDNIVAVFQVSREEDRDIPYMVMQLVEGETLEARLVRDGKLPLSEIVRIGLQISSGLAAAHDKGLIHRDVKPGNVLLEKGTDRVKLTDFGLARATEDLRLTRTGMVAGTPLYMAPEQARGEELDQRADLFSLGVVLYEMATGIPPFEGKTPLAVLRRLADEPHRPVRELNPEVPEWLAAIIDRLLAKDPANRFQTAREVAQTLEQHYLLLRTSTGDVVVCPRAKVRRKVIKLMVAAGLAGVVVTLGTLAALKVFWPRGGTGPAGPEPAAIRKYSDGVLALAASPTADFLAIGAPGGNVELWSPMTDKVQATIPAERQMASSLAISPDGAYLATAGADDPAKLWSIKDHKAPLLTLKENGPVRSLAFSPDGKLLITGGRDGNLTVMEMPSGKVVYRKQAITDNKWVTAVAVSPDSETIATAGADGQVILWDTATGEKRVQVRGPQEGSVLALAFSPDGSLLASAGSDKVVRLWNPSNGKLVAELEGHEAVIRCLCFCPRGKVLASGSDDRTVRIWNVEKREERMVVRGATNGITTLAVSRDAKLFASGSRDGTVRVYNVPLRCSE
jgi:WD40 repeat protein